MRNHVAKRNRAAKKAVGWLVSPSAGVKTRAN
jgi:hypothetical protein